MQKLQTYFLMLPGRYLKTDNVITHAQTITIVIIST
jgi:hypothetical protein